MSVIIGTTEDRTVPVAIETLAGDTSRLTYGAAIELLVEAAAGSPDTHDGAAAMKALLAALSAHPEPQVRVGVARAIGRIPSEPALRALRRTVDREEDGQLLAAASRALSAIGTEVDIARLRAASIRTAWAPAQVQASASARLLAHRVGARFDPADVAMRLPGEDARTLPVTGRFTSRIAPIEPSFTARRLAPQRATWQVNALVPEKSGLAGAFTCGTVTHHVLSSPDVAALRDRPGIAATLLGINESTGATFVRWLVLTQPSADGLAVTVAKPSGKVGFVGTGAVADDGSISISVAAVDVAGSTAATVSASLSGGELTVAGRGDQKITSPRRRPFALEGIRR